MVKISDILSKPVINLSNAQILGTIDGVFFDQKLKQPRILKLLNNENKQIIIPYCVIAFVGKDAITIKSEQTDSITPSDINILGIDSYSFDGKFLGKVSDVCIEKESVQSIIIGEEKLLPSKLLSLSSNVLIFNTSDKPYKLYKKTTKKEENVPSPSINKSNISVPTKIMSNEQSYNFLLNKKVTKNILADNGNILIFENTIVTRDIIYLAKENDKLVQLALHTI